MSTGVEADEILPPREGPGGRARVFLLIGGLWVLFEPLDQVSAWAGATSVSIARAHR